MTDHTFFSFPPRLVFYILFRINSSSEESFPSLYAWKSTFSSSQSYCFTSQPIIRSLPAAHHGEVCEDLSSVGSYRSPCFVYNFFRNVYFFLYGSSRCTPYGRTPLTELRTCGFPASGVLPVDSCYPAYLKILPNYSFSSGFSGSDNRTGFSWCYIGMPLYFLYCP